MSLHISVVSIEGNHLADLAEVFERCNYRVIGSEMTTDADSAARQLDQHVVEQTKVRKVAYFSDGWTHIVDPELVIMSDSAWADYSARWDGRIVSWVCEGCSGTYGFSLYEAGAKVRSVCRTEGRVYEDEGVPQREEAGIDWAHAFEDDVLAVAERLGAPYGYLEGVAEYHVFLLDESHLQ